ncbi:hypothetical protein H0H87_010926 [Tephrocybe sp. NHM501043]|nr:hypothetical protein H0H87_010926 [Tephrocybe sp. NHM501043]
MTTQADEETPLLQQSLFFLTQAFTVLHWSRMSDFAGRKPVILIGLFGLSISMFCFGLSRTFWGLVLSRCLNGALNGNIGVIKSMMVELTDSTNIAQAYAYMPMAWSTGTTLGPIIGGSLSHPTERFPILLGANEFLKKYPYFLPCAVPATYTAIAWLVTFIFLKETLRTPVPFSRLFSFRKDKSPLSMKGVIGSQETPTLPDVPQEEKPLPLHALLTPRVIIAAGNYAFLSLVEIAFRAVQPLFLSTPIALGGLGLPPPIIGNVLSLYGICNGIFQVFFFARIHDRFGSKKTFVGGIACAFPCFISFPIISHLAKTDGLSNLVWAGVIAQTLLSIGMRAVFIFIAAASPNRASLGATNGLSQMTVSFMRAIGPAAANSLFSLSIEKDYLSGYLVYYILITIVGVAISFLLTTIMSSFQALMALSHTQTLQSQSAVQSALAERQRKEEQKRKLAEERDRKEQELAKKRRMMLLEEDRKRAEREAKRAQEQAAIETERQKRAEMERISYQHGPKKAKALASSSDGSTPKWPSSASQARTQEDVRKRRLPDDDDSSGPEFLTREEKRQRKQQQEMRKLFNTSKRSTTSGYSRAGKRLPGGAVDVMTGSQPVSDSSSSKKSVRERISAMPNTLTKLNTVKRDTRTIDEIMQDRAKLRENKTLDGDQARGFNDWFPDKKESKKTPTAPTSAAPSGVNTPSSSQGSSTPQPAAASSKKPAAPPKSSLLKTAATKAAATSVSYNAKPSAKVSRPSTLSAKESLANPPKASKVGYKVAPSSAKKRARSPSYSELEDSEDSDRPYRKKQGSGLGDAIWQMFGKSRDSYVGKDVFSDDEDMEVDASYLEKEELRSARIAKKEDSIAIEEERRREEEKRRRKKQKERESR